MSRKELATTVGGTRLVVNPSCLLERLFFCAVLEEVDFAKGLPLLGPSLVERGVLAELIVRIFICIRKIVSIILCLLLFTDFVVRIFVPKIGAAEGLGSSGMSRHGVGGSVAG